MKPQLVLDIGGVLAANLSPSFWSLLGELTGRQIDAVYKSYKKEVSAQLWRGQMNTGQFWEWLLTELPSLNIDKAQSALGQCLTPLPAVHEIARWSELADVHILSNHCTEWVKPLLDPLMPYLTIVAVSSDIGCCKPFADSFAYVQAKLPAGCPVLFVDDHESNLLAAKLYGWFGQLADEAGLWIPQIPVKLRELGRH